MNLPGSEAVTLTSIVFMLGPHVSVASVRTPHHIRGLKRKERASPPHLSFLDLYTKTLPYTKYISLQLLLGSCS